MSKETVLIEKLEDMCPGAEIDEVKDAKNDITVKITERDSEISTPGDPNSCAFSMKCKKQLQLDGALVFKSKAYLIQNGIALRLNISPSVRAELVSFDRGHGVEPGTYVFKAPSKSKKLGGNSSGSDKRSGKHGKVRAPIHITEGLRLG